MKLIKSATLYKMDLPAADLVAQHLEERRFTEMTSLEMTHHGFAPIEETGELLTVFPGGFAFGFRIDAKLLPSSVVSTEVKARVERIEQEQGYKPGKKQRREIREQVIDDLLPKALVKTTNLTIFYDTEHQILVVPTTSMTTADTVTGAMIHAIGSIKTSTIHVSDAKHGLTTRLRSYIAGQDHDAFGEFKPDDKVVLKGEAGSVSVTASDLDTVSEGIVEALGAGLTVDAIRLYHGRDDDAVGLSFVLGQDFRIRSIDFGAKPDTEGTEAMTNAEKWQHEASVQMLQLIKAVTHLCDLLGYKPPVDDEQQAA